MRKALFLLAIALLTIGTFAQEPTEGTLYAVTKKGTELGACPLKNTAVRADISGFLARVYVKQEFENSFSEPIEAVYTFPLSHGGAVDDMTMTIGTRVVRGKIMKRGEARTTYENAKAAGQAASLLDQERPNIFTQSVANIMPGEKVVIEITYVETLKYEDGSYEFVFPMTVGPRYIPGSGSVTDANKIRPPVADSRPGHDISVEVNLNAGVPVESVRSTSHRIEQLNYSPAKAKVSLQGEKVIPNKDFILRYDVSGKRLEDGILAHRDSRGGFFTLMLQPPDTVAPEDRTPKEIVFVLDTSGSMSGFPIEKAKEAMKLSLDGLYPEDTFNLITFAGDTHILFDKPVYATQANLERARAFLDSRQGGGGTEMMKAIKASLDPSDSQEHLRIVCFMTDAFIGNDDEIIAEIQRHPKARVFSFGIGSSVNRSLLDKMAEAGKGEVEYVGLNDDGSKAAKRFYERVRTPMLTDLSIDWNGMPVNDVYPNKLGDLFSAKPVIVNARYTKGASGTIKLKGTIAGQPYERSIKIDLPETENASDVLATLWARRRVDQLSMDALKGGPSAEALNKEIEGIGLEYRIMTSFTSFVAVEEQVVNANGTPTRVGVPVAIPEGVDPEMSGARKADEKDALLTVAQQVGLTGGGGKKATDQKVGRIPTPSATPVPSTQRNAKNKAWGDPNAKTGSLSNGPGTAGGMGTGTGSGSGTGTGSAATSSSARLPANTATVNSTSTAVATTVEVTAGDLPAIDMTKSEVSTSISGERIAAIPKGTNFSSALRIAPGVRRERLAGGFSIDGSSGSENTFIIDGTEVTNFRSGGMNESSARLEGRAVSVPKPVYPEAAKAKKALGKVDVEVRIDAAGNVVSAKAVTGNSLLFSAVEAAAMLAKFAPTYANGRAVRVSGTIRYDFKSADEIEITPVKMKAEPPTAEEMKAIRLAEKLHFWVYEVMTRQPGDGAGALANEAAFVRDGTASVRVVLSTRSEAVLAKLKAAGFDAEAKSSGSSIPGRIARNKLSSLAEIAEVVFVMPAI